MAPGSTSVKQQVDYFRELRQLYSENILGFEWSKNIYGPREKPYIFLSKLIQGYFIVNLPDAQR